MSSGKKFTGKNISVGKKSDNYFKKSKAFHCQVDWGT